MNWLDDYRSKLQSPAEAVKKVKSGDRVYYAGNAAIPQTLVRALAERKGELEDVQLNHVLLVGVDPLAAPGMEVSFRHNSLFVGPADRQAVNEGRGDYVPIFLGQIPRLFRERIIPLDVAMVQCSPPDEHGFMSLGVETLASIAACQTARTVIAQVNEKMPRVLGDSFMHVNRVDAIVESTEPLPELEAKPATEVEKAIAAHVIPLIEPGSTVQMGIGGIPDSVWESMEGDLDLGVHTEMISNGGMRAIQRGVVTGTRKNLHQGKVILTFALGSEELYDFLDNNPLIEAHTVDYVNDPFIISQNENMVAVNSAIEVDLTGQVCSDSIGPYIYSGFGGQVDFIRGAARSKGGRPIIALPSTARKGTMSRIVPFLKEGAGVVTSRADVHYVVTEYGAVNLFGKNLRERAKALIQIAAPDFQEELEHAAKDRKLLT
ncbi:MAG: acetyl-CoA hydrolase/transferase C-terminal domain-containing protein [Gemmatimonadota bacterium]